MKPNRRRLVLQGGVASLILGAAFKTALAQSDAAARTQARFEVTHTDAEWRQLLSGPEYEVLRQRGTERPYTSALNGEHGKGIFTCAGCGLELYSSEAKYESGTGWPSFFKPIDSAVRLVEDKAFGMVRTEVECRRCGGHLGHVFNDGPRPTGMRYCMNGVAMKFKPASA